MRVWQEATELQTSKIHFTNDTPCGACDGAVADASAIGEELEAAYTPRCTIFPVANFDVANVFRANRFRERHKGRSLLKELRWGHGSLLCVRKQVGKEPL
eukprot:9292220-Pyramimonas_sp.AAC.2